jgi:hypothetical protein
MPGIAVVKPVVPVLRGGVSGIAFDPTLHTDPDVQLVPHWLSGFRGAAYSRDGRNAK